MKEVERKNKDLEKEKEDFKNSLLSSLGVDRLIFLPRKSDFVNCEEIIKFVKNES